MPTGHLQKRKSRFRNAAWRLTAVCCLLYAVAFFTYGNTLRVPFYFDDLTKIVENPHIRLNRLAWSEISQIPRGQQTGRSLPFFTFALNYYFHQDQAEGYHLVNIFIHICCSFLVFLIAGHTLRQCGRESLLIPLLAALLWLTHPLHIQSVTYLVQRINSLAALFFLMCLWLYIRFRQGVTAPDPDQSAFCRYLPAAGAMIFGIMALLSKQNTAILPIVILLYEWHFFQNRDPAWLKNKGTWFLFLIPLLILISFVYLGNDPLGRILAGYADKPFTLGQRLLSEGRVIIYYISLLAFPHPDRLILDYDFPASTGLTSPATTLAALAALAAMLIGAWRMRQNRLASFAVLWFLVTLVVESSVIGLALIFEHRTYLPSVFPAIALAAGLGRSGRWRPLAVVLLTALIACNGYWTMERNRVWQDRLAFWRDGAEKSPAKARPHNNYGMAAREADDFETAITEYEQAIALARGTDQAFPLNNLGMLYFQRGDTDKAMAFFEKAIQADPDFFKPYMNLGSLFNLTGDNQKALAFLKRAAQINPYFPALHVALGKVYYETGDTRRAIEHCRRALELDPLDISAENNLGAIFLGSGEADQALTHLQRVLQMAPNHPEANINIGLAYHQMNNLPLAAFHLERAIFLAPEHPGARAELGLLFLEQGRQQKAQQHLEKAVALQPDLIKARLALAALFLAQERDGQATEQYRQVLRYDPDNPTARHRLQDLTREAVPGGDFTRPPPP